MKSKTLALNLTQRALFIGAYPSKCITIEDKIKHLESLLRNNSISKKAILSYAIEITGIKKKHVYDLVIKYQIPLEYPISRKQIKALAETV